MFSNRTLSVDWSAIWRILLSPSARTSMGSLPPDWQTWRERPP